MCIQIIAAARDVQEKTEIYAPFNILPLDSAGASQSIMQLEEVSHLPRLMLMLILILRVCVSCVMRHGRCFGGESLDL